MATSVEISAIADLILETFGGDAQLFKSWLVRSKLETEATQLQSAIRKQQAERDTAVDTAEESIQSLQAAYNAKLAEIDNL